MPSKPRLVIIGTGWGGFYISEHIDLKLYDVTVISPRRTSAYTPLLASAAVGLFNFYLAEEAVRSKSRAALHFHKATVLDVDFQKQICRCAPAFDEDEDLFNHEFDIEYDLLVLSPGCIPNTYNTPGVQENAIFIKNVSDAMRVRKRMFDQLEKASLPRVTADKAKDLLHIAIVGGGPTGIELTAELDDLARAELTDIYPDVSRHITISVYDVAPKILSNYDKKLHEYAAKKLENRRVSIKTSTNIEKVDNQALYTKEHGRIPYGMLIWATGNKHVPLLEKLEDVTFPEKGLKRILTDDRCRVLRDPEHKSHSQEKDEPNVTTRSKAKSGSTPRSKSKAETSSSKPESDSSTSSTPTDGEGKEIKDDQPHYHANVFAIGDAADIQDSSLPTTAEVACQKAKYLVDNLHLLAGHAPQPHDGSITTTSNHSTNASSPTWSIFSVFLPSHWNARAAFSVPFKYANKPLVSYIGARDGVIAGQDENDSGWTGHSAWVAWRSGSIMWNRNWRSRIMILLTWTLNSVLGKEVAKM